MTISQADSSGLNGAQSAGLVSDEGAATGAQTARIQGLFSKRRLLDDEGSE